MCKKHSIFRLFDYIIICIVLAAIIFTIKLTITKSETPPFLIINTAEGEWVYPLDVDKELVFTGPLGKTIVTIKDGKAFFVDSPCTDKLCVHMPPMFKAGDWAACLPNRVAIHIGNINKKTDKEFDAISF